MNVFNELDQISGLFVTKRNDEESNSEFRDRLLFEAGNPYDSTRNGILNAISNQTEFKIKEVARITQSEDGPITIKIRNMKLNNESLLLGNTIGGFLDELNIPFTTIDAEYINLPARNLLDYNSEKVYQDIYVDNLFYYKFINNEDEILLPGTLKVEGMTESDYTVINKSIIKTTDKALTFNNPISFKTTQREIILKASPIYILTSYEALEYDGLESNDLTTIIEQSDKKYPLRWQ
jgi:hypothetical protein